jgi:hypothetical protein
MKSNVPLLLRIGGILVLIVGTIVVLVMGAAWLNSRNAHEWPTAEARVIRSEIEVSKTQVPLGRSRRTHVGFFALRLEYEYEVDGERYTGDQVSLAANPCGYDRGEIERWTHKYSLGSTIDVHYKPSYPASSVVEPTGGPGPLGLGFGILAVVAGVVMRRMGKRPQPAGQAYAQRPAAGPSSPPAEPRHEVRQPEPAPATSAPLKSRRMHWSIRAAIVLVGVVLLLLGAVTLPVGITQYVQAGDTVGPGNVTPAGRLVGVVFMGLFVLFGGLLMWVGLRRRGGRAEAGRQIGVGCPSHHLKTPPATT